MDNGKQIIKYLDELAQVLITLKVRMAFHMLIAGGAYMLIQKQRRSTEDIDFALLEPVQLRQTRKQRVVVQNAEVARNTVPYAQEFKQAVAIIARRYPRKLPPDWLNDEAAVYYYDDAPCAEAIYWRSFANILHVYLPTPEYMLATKIAAYRPKDANDIRVLIRELNIQTYEQAKAIIDTFLLPDAQEFWEVETKLEELFL